MLTHLRDLRHVRVLLMMAIAVLIAGLPMAISGPGHASAAGTLTVRAGDGETGYAVNEFLPNRASIAMGDTVRFDFPWPEPHTITFGQPTGDPTVPTFPGQSSVTYSGSGFLTSGFTFGPTFDVTFTGSGEMAYFCAIHPDMTGTINVLAPGDLEQLDTQFSADARGDAQYNSMIARLKAVAASLGASGAAVTSKPGGGKTFSLTIGGMVESSDVQQYFPPAVTIQAGDTIEWKTSIPTPHTVTFGAPPPVQGDPTQVAPVVPAGAWDGVSGVHSGTLGVGWGPLSFSLTFGKTGSFNYYCLLHEAQGMRGSVVVGAAAPAATATPVPPKPPATGSGHDGSGRGGTFLVLLVAGLALAFTGSAIVTARR